MNIIPTYRNHTEDYWIALEAEVVRLREDKKRLREVLEGVYSDALIEAVLDR